ncbi:hypothetical protein HMPREF2866_13210 [Enterococcus sp. HMSC067C01]|nr:hypothetical protein HMPREF2866_13210 [Enterococcus sp. HMSC067C01]
MKIVKKSDRGCEPTVQLRVTRNNFNKQFLVFVEYCDLGPRSRQENTVYSEKRDCDKNFVTILFVFF